MKKVKKVRHFIVKVEKAIGAPSTFRKRVKVKKRLKKVKKVRHFIVKVEKAIGALAGACPGPMFTLVGAGFAPILVVIVASVFGTFLYGLVKDKLPH